MSECWLYIQFGTISDGIITCMYCSVVNERGFHTYDVRAEVAIYPKFAGRQNINFAHRGDKKNKYFMDIIYGSALGVHYRVITQDNSSGNRACSCVVWEISNRI